MALRYVIVQQPDNAAQLFLLYHGVNDNPDSMAQIGSWFAQAFPQAQVVSVGAPYPASAPQGRQWYAEIPEHDRSQQQGVDAVMPSFVESVRHWQQQSGVRPEATALVGFSQGGTMVLEGVKAQPDLAGRVVAFSGRYVTLPEQASTRNTIHLIHGDYDEQVPMQHAEAAMQRLTALGGDVTLDIVDDLPHAIDERSMQLALNHLRYTVPRRYFDEALSGAKPGDDDVVMMV
ncbi:MULTISPECIES: esterase [Pantoea]|jgi:phospholipase/carboxylesterase|uniref:Hydrolase n=1 Tax=Pantoea dispersa TaxID=59814 RepID=A0A8E1VA44_9GAMM|nr:MULTISPECIES: esterase [Pantoea]MBK4768480.1 esterase [Pantoea sp. Morm]MBK4784380.1 esterase [Pantoea sp. Pent]ERH63684.1 hydrolase [Pantoea dispersa EGD-AAK13]KAA6101773.1 esterase [Pantoea sp. B_9]KAA6115647.1 esterase [Pantoea sp. B_10]